MYRPNQCHRCGLILEVNCKCTPEQMIKHGEDQIKDFERSQALSVWTDSQMVKHLREQGYKVEKRRPNPKKSKRKR